MRLPDELDAWLTEQAADRMVSRTLLTVRALELLRDQLEPAPDPIGLPAAPRPRHLEPVDALG